MKKIISHLKLSFLLTGVCVLCACGNETDTVSPNNTTSIDSSVSTSATEEGSQISVDSSASQEISSIESLASESSSLTSEGSSLASESSSLASEGSSQASEGSSQASEGSSLASEGSSLASENSSSAETSQSMIGSAASIEVGTNSSNSSAPNAPEQETIKNKNSESGTISPLHVDGTFLVNENGEHVQLYGMSTHGLSFFPEYVTYDTFATLHDDWNINCVRLAMYTAEYNGYCTGGDKESLKNLIRNGVQYATDLGMYVIVDWHILSDQDPNVYKQDAKDFFSQMSAEFSDQTNVIYEICNEPNGYATWESVKAYAEEVIPCIRQNDADAVILVGSPTWSQDIDKALANPLDIDNVMYTLHFYAATHKEYLRERLENCVNSGLPVFVSEFGMCDASGNGGNDFDSAQKWIDLLDQHDISFICWNLANKNESSSVIRSGVSTLSGWSEDDLSESGKWIRNIFRNK